MRSSSKSPFLLKASAVYVTALLSCVFVFIIVCAADGFFMGGRGLFTSVWHPESKQFGILPVMAATAALSLSSLALGWLVSFGCVCYIHGFGGKRGGALLLSLLRVMTAIPTVVYGFASVFLLVPIVRNGFGGSGLSWFTATLILALLITPTMVLVMDGAVEQAVRESGLTAASLGFSRAEHLVFVVLPSCKEWLWLLARGAPRLRRAALVQGMALGRGAARFRTRGGRHDDSDDARGQRRAVSDLAAERDTDADGAHRPRIRCSPRAACFSRSPRGRTSSSAL